MEFLSSCDFVKKMKKVSKDEVHIDIEIPGNLISENTQNYVEFSVILGANFPLSPPRVFCKTGVI